MKKRIIILTLLVAFLAGCSHLSVRHLQKNPFHLNQAEHLSMRYWDFEYVSLVENGEYVINGVALPKIETLPSGADWLHDFWLSVYLSDDRGRVVAKDVDVFPTQKLDPDKGVKFEFKMSPERMPSTKNIFLTFGYRMSLTESEHHSPLRERPLTSDKSVFFASEGALAR